MLAINQWLAMGGYEAYVWGSVGLFLGTLFVGMFMVKSHFRSTRKKLVAWLQGQSK